MAKTLAATVALISIVASAIGTFLFLENRYARSSELSDMRQELKQFLMKPGLRIESDTLTVGTEWKPDYDAGGGTEISFSKSFKEPPAVIVGISKIAFDSGSSYVVEAAARGITSNGFVLGVSKPRGTALRSLTVWWLAYGE